MGVAGAGTAHAGGAPDLGSVTVDRYAYADPSGDLRLTGSYTCTAEGTGAIRADVYGWTTSGPATSFEIPGVLCDGAVHDWSVTTHDSTYPIHGRALVWGSLEVCDPVAGTCPADLCDGEVTVRPTR